MFEPKQEQLVKRCAAVSIVVTAVGEKTADVRNIPEDFLYGKITL